MERSNQEENVKLREGLEQIIRGLEIIKQFVAQDEEARIEKTGTPKVESFRETVEKAEIEKTGKEAESVLPDREDIREILVKKTKQGKGADVKELLGIFRADRLSDVKEEHFEELYQMAIKL